MDIIRPIMWQLLSATSYLHRNWIMHRDIKPTNILIFDNESSSGRIKLTDFGLARSFQEPVLAFNELERVVVTLWYRAPELLLGCKTYGPAVDIWAIGCVFAKVWFIIIIIIIIITIIISIIIVDDQSQRSLLWYRYSIQDRKNTLPIKSMRTDLFDCGIAFYLWLARNSNIWTLF